MENYSNYSSYPDSRDSSPRSRDCDAASWDEPSQQQQGGYKVKLMCSYGGRIQPRPHDNQLAYVGGDTKILSLDRSVRLPALLSKLASISPADDLCFKYQLPGEDLDALISVTNDEDLDHMLLEYDRLHRASPKPARLRLFLFPAPDSSDRQWFVDALNSAQIQPPSAAADSSPPSSQPPPDFLFGLDKPPPAESEEPEIHRQIQDLQRLQIAAQEQRKYEETANPNPNPTPNPRGYAGGGGDYYSQSFRPQEKLAPTQAQPLQAPMPMQLPVHMPASYVPDRQIAAAGGGYHMTATPHHPPPQQPLPPGAAEQPVYLIQTPGGVFQHHQAAAAPMRQPFYHQRMVPDAVYHRDAAMYSTAPMMPKPEPQQNYAQVGYDSAGRQVYYTTTAAPTAYQNVAPVSGAGGASLSQDGKVVMSKVSQSSPM